MPTYMQTRRWDKQHLFASSVSNENDCTPCMCLIGWGLPFGPLTIFGKTPTKHAGEPRDRPCRPRAPKGLGLGLLFGWGLWSDLGQRCRETSQCRGPTPEWVGWTVTGTSPAEVCFLVAGGLVSE